MPVFKEADQSARSRVIPGSIEVMQAIRSIGVVPDVVSELIQILPAVQVPETRGVLTPEQIQAMESMSFIQRLDFITNQPLSKYGEEEIATVKRILEYEELHGKKPPKGFKRIGDFYLYFNIHVEWYGRSSGQMISDKETGASAFYETFYDWAKNESKGDKKKTTRLINQLFPFHNERRAHFLTIEEWMEEFARHPEWQGRSPTEMLKDSESGANGFYQAFRKWVNKEAKGDRAQRRKLLDAILPLKIVDRSSYTTIDDWKREFDKNPNWQGKNTSELQENKEGRSFYGSFRRWVLKNARTKDEERVYREAIFSSNKGESDSKDVEQLSEESAEILLWEQRN